MLAKILRAIGDTPKNVYAPSDDTFLMLNAVAQLGVEGRTVLDVGTGSGILGLFCAMRGAQVTISDIDESALRQAQQAARTLGLKLQPLLSDLFSKVQGQFEIVLFNPPYLPSSTIDDRAVDGGLRGSLLSDRFLDELPSHLKRDSMALLLVSSVNDVPSLLEKHAKLQFSVIAKRALFFEELRVLRVGFRDDFSS